MTGEAHTSSSRIICRRPRAVRRAMASASGTATECTVNASAGTGSAAADAGADELEPGIEAEGERGEDEPLACVAVVLLHVEGGRGPVALQDVPRPRGAGLQERQRQQGRTGLAGIRPEVEILPDGPARFRPERVEP